MTRSKREQPSVLIVDDRVPNHEVLEAALQGLGAKLRRAYSGAEALAHIEDIEPAVVLLDVQMPGMNGYEVAERIRAHKERAHVPMIFITADAARAAPDQAYESGAVDFILKPVAPRLLRAKVEVFLRLYEQKADLQAKEEELLRSNQLLQEFAHAASHDLKEPLRTVRGFVGMLGESLEGVATPNQVRYLGFVNGATERMQELISGLLEYARSGEGEIRIAEVSLHDVVQACLADLDEAVRESRAELFLGELPVVLGESQLLKRVLQNLLANALKFSDGPPRVHVSATEVGDMCEVSVRDEGVGFDMKYLGNVFQPFKRAHTTSEFPGSGIGLAVCKQVVERLGGGIRIASELGKGTTVTFTVPKA